MIRSPKDLRTSFAHGKAKSVPVIVRKPAKAATESHEVPRQHSPSVTAPVVITPAKGSPSSTPVGSARTVASPQSAQHKRERPERTKQLTAVTPKADFDGPTSGHTQHRIVVVGCGSVPMRQRGKKRPFLEFSALGKQRRLARYAVTCDGEAVLPKSTDRVRVVLLDMTKEITVTVEPRPAGSRKKRAPARWIERRDTKPAGGRYRPPKASI